jgi:hypothetical protein
MITELLMFFAISCAFYIAWASICRLRHGQVSRLWATLYTAVLGHAMWTLWDIVCAKASMRDALILISVALYVHLTRSAWDGGVPTVARPNAINSAKQV